MAAIKGCVLICLCKYKCKHIEKGTFAIFEQPPVFVFTLRQFEHAKMCFLCSQKTGLKASACISASMVLAFCFCIFLAVIV